LEKAESIQLCDFRVGQATTGAEAQSGYDSHDATSPSSFPHPPSTSALPLLNLGLGVSRWENYGIKDVCRYVLEHFGGLMRLIIFS